MSEAVSSPRFSVIVTCYNQQEFIKDAVDSVLAQNCASKEVIVVDDGSRDLSIELLKSYGHSVRLLPLHSNVGVNEARNRGAALARGEYVIFLDGDDLMTPHALRIYELLISERKPAVIIGAALWCEGKISQIASSQVPMQVKFIEYTSPMAKDRSTGLYTGAFVISRKAFQDVGGWTPGMWHLDGQDLYAKLSYAGPAILLLNPWTMLYRIHTTNSILSVHAYVPAVQQIMAREYSGQYPGGWRKAFERYARHGGVIFFCLRKLFRAHLFREAFPLMFSGWAMILAAIIRRALIQITGKRPVQILDFRPKAFKTNIPS